MLHVVHMLRRRYPDCADTITRTLLVASGSALLAGLGMLIAI